MIRVLIVEDSLTARQYLEHIINSDDQLQVVGVARNGEEGVRLVRLKRPDIVTMDIHMPGMDGYEATRRIMEECPVPIVVVTTSWHREELRNSFQAMEAGALTAMEKPPGPGHPRSERLVAKLVQTIKTMSQVKVVRRIPSKEVKGYTVRAIPSVPPARGKQRVDLVAMGASTGGPPVIKEIISGLNQGFSLPVLVVQHITSGFLDGMVEWLSSETGLLVRVASHGERIRGGCVYFAPDGHHMGVTGDGRIMLSNGPAENGVRPSVSHLFRSVARAYGARSAGVLLTGMGKDGALELVQMREKGAVTVAQERESCVVYGMPAEAVRLNGAVHLLPPAGITGFLNSIEKQGLGQGEGEGKRDRNERSI
ncbi:MAG TPA: chemotaxis-specific protein-glutamate methyltransferase CheB [Deltaproteobacteria bacterium]|nr:chemotaxis-specific protein-glutamate methyltransferase CheB [Deltaproteobacteria bacterium]